MHQHKQTVRRQVFSTVVDATGDEPGIVISTQSVDRERDVVMAEGAVLDGYQRNPVVMFGHEYSELPVGVSTEVKVLPKRGLYARWRWLEGDDRAARVRNAYEQGVLRAASVGFRAIEWEPMSGGGHRFTKWELLEWSLVPVPANPDAVRVLRALGLHDGDEPVLDLVDDDSLIDVTSELAAEGHRALARSRRLDPAKLAGLVGPIHDVDVAKLRDILREVVRAGVRAEARKMADQVIRQLRGRLD